MRTRRRWLVSLSAILALALGLPPAVAAASPSTWAWVVARQATTAAYTPAAKDRGNSSGGTNTVVRSAVGSYTVKLPGVANASDGSDVQVSALGGAGYCTVVTWNPVSLEIDVVVHCHSLIGGPSDKAFSLMFLTAGGSSGTIGFAWADQKSATDYTPDSSYQWPGTITVHRTAAGQYTVRLPSFDASVLDVQVTGYGDAYCSVVWTAEDGSDALVHVQCPADSRFNLLVMDSVGPTGVSRPKAAYALVEPLQPTPASRVPAALRYSSASTTPTLSRSAVGQYVVTLPQMPKGGMALVTPLNAGSVTCYLSQIRKNATPQKVGVKCVHMDGSAADTNFYLAYTK